MLLRCRGLSPTLSAAGGAARRCARLCSDIAAYRPHPRLPAARPLRCGRFVRHLAENRARLRAPARRRGRRCGRLYSDLAAYRPHRRPASGAARRRGRLYSDVAAYRPHPRLAAAPPAVWAFVLRCRGLSPTLLGWRRRGPAVWAFVLRCRGLSPTSAAGGAVACLVWAFLAGLAAYRPDRRPRRPALTTAHSVDAAVPTPTPRRIDDPGSVAVACRPGESTS